METGHTGKANNVQFTHDNCLLKALREGELFLWLGQSGRISGEEIFFNGCSKQKGREGILSRGLAPSRGLEAGKCPRDPGEEFE